MAAKIGKFERANLKTIDEAIGKALNDVAAQFGLTIERKRGKFSPTTYDISYQLQTVSSDGIPVAPKRQFEALAPLLGLDPTMFGFTYQERGRAYTVVGINPKSPKNSVCLERDDGASFCCPPSLVISRFAQQQKQA